MSVLTVKKGIIAVAVIAMVGFVTTAFAGWGGGGNMNRGPGRHQMGAEGLGCRYFQNLTDEQQKALEQERQAFVTETVSLRQNMTSKNLELRSELAKADPDAQKAAAIQKEISALESEFDRKHLDFMIKAKKIAPDAGQGHMMGGMGGMRGQGPGYEHGRGPRGGYCWE
ncbi:MAG: periplasmic heavy metal sensor [Deltaproteobacteria bacterium]|nr:periplasmic heavy metal sensor [Deltaproteobacteria bacterium]